MLDLFIYILVQLSTISDYFTILLLLLGIYSIRCVLKCLID